MISGINPRLRRCSAVRAYIERNRSRSVLLLAPLSDSTNDASLHVSLHVEAGLLLLIKELLVRVLPAEPDRTKVAGIGSGGLFSLPSRVRNCKQIKRLAKRRSESVVLRYWSSNTRIEQLG